MYDHLYICFCQHGCAKVSTFGSVHGALSQCTCFRCPCDLLCSLSVCPGVSFSVSPYSFCMPVPVSAGTCLCQWVHLPFAHACPCEHRSWYVWDLCAHVSVFMCVSLVNINISSLFCLCPGGNLGVPLHRILCPTYVSVHICRFICGESYV